MESMQRALFSGALHRFKDTFIGGRKFYRAVLALVLPIIAQTTVSNFVNLLDNVMVGQVGTVQMSGVAIANQLIFVFNLTVFGATSGAGIFGAQFAGAKDWEGLRQSFRFKILVALGICAAALSVMAFFDDPAISLYLKGEGSAADAAAMLFYGKQYLHIMLWGLLPFALTQCYSATLRETGETVLPMAASMTAVLINLSFNYLLIYGKLGFPALGVKGAAIATALSRFVELGIIAVWSHTHRKKFFFMKGVYRHFRIGRKLAGGIAAKSLPLLANELFWALGMAALMQIFSTRGLSVVAGLNIASTVTNLFNVFMISLGVAAGVMVGQALGANDIALARRCSWRLIFFSVCICIFLGSVLALFADAIPNIYKTGDEVRRLAAGFMRTSAMYMVFNAITFCCYFTIRAGGKTFLTLLFDSAYTWAVCVPLAFVMVHYTGLGIELLYPLCYLTDVLKCVVGLLVVRAGYWAKNIVGQGSPAQSGYSHMGLDIPDRP
jgi:putative MATE family efflux protein